MNLLEEIRSHYREKKQKKAWDRTVDYWLGRLALDSQRLTIRDLRAAQRQVREVRKIQKRFATSKEKDAYVC